MKPDICHVKITTFEMRYKSNMLKDTTWRLKTSECSIVTVFENLSTIASLCGFQNIWSFLVFVTMSVYSFILFILIACWLAISEEMPLKSITSFSWIKFLKYPFLIQVNQVQMCMNWKDIVISCIPFLRWYNLIWIMSISLLFLSAPQVFPKFPLILIPIKLGVSSFANRIVRFWSPDMSDLHTGFQ
jgi:hypothetical protein